MKNPTVNDFKKARAEFDDSVKDVAGQFGCSRQYVYEVLKYPNKNPDLHRQITEYINSADINKATAKA
jgi:predicted transcriptional regulator